MMKKYFAFAFALLMAFACGKENTDNPDPTPVAPTTVTLSSASANVAQAGEEITLDITAPSRPEVSGAPDWVTVKLGIYDAQPFKMTGVKITVAANPTYETRTATLTFKAGAASAAFAISQAGKEVIPDPVLPDNDAVKLATQATFDGVKAAGFTSARIPVSWLKMIGPAPDYKIDETWLNRVYEVVQYAHNAGLTVIVNTHHDENHGVDNTYQWLDIKNAATNSTLNAQIKEEIKAVWTQIANKFKDCGDWLIFESFNELNDGGWGWSEAFRADPTKQCNIRNEWNQVFVDAVRATGGNNATRWLGVPTYAANPSFEQYAKLPTDSANKIMLSVHFYDPSDYTIGDEQWSDWGHTGAAGKKSSGGDEEHVKEVFNNLFIKYIKKNVPVYVGEFGCSMRAKSDTRAWKFYCYYMEYVAKAAHAFGLPGFLWDNGAADTGKEQHGYINHGTGAYIGNSKEVVDLLVKGMTSTDSSYTLQSVYDSAPTF